MAGWRLGYTAKGQGMTVLVLHADGDRLTPDQRYEVMAGFRPTHAEYCVDLLAQGLYKPVAVVAVPSLDTAYQLTNTVHAPWYAPPQAGPDTHTVCLLPPGTGCRSTSVGDIMLMDERVYVVASMGFTEVTAAAKAAVPQEVGYGYAASMLECLRTQLTAAPETLQ